jgi:hypothetical protein
MLNLQDDEETSNIDGLLLDDDSEQKDCGMVDDDDVNDGLELEDDANDAAVIGSDGAKTETTRERPFDDCPLCDYQVGDHVYIMCPLIPGMSYQHHGIVMDVFWKEYNQEWIQENTDGEETADENVASRGEWMMTISDYSRDEQVPDNGQQQDVDEPVRSSSWKPPTSSIGPGSWGGSSGPSSASFSLNTTTGTEEGRGQKLGFFRTYAAPCDGREKWHKVDYGSGRRKDQSLYAAPALVCRRMQFLVDREREGDDELVPEYHVLSVNCECAAVWCKTGKWTTLQALDLLTVGQATAVATAAILWTQPLILEGRHG